METGFARCEARLALAAQGAGDPFDALRRQCRAYAEFGVAEPQMYRVMFGAWEAGPKALGTYGRRPHPDAAALTASIQRCLDAGARTPPWQCVPGLPAVVIAARHDRAAGKQTRTSLAGRR